MYALRLDCVDQPGIVAAVAATLANAQCNIEESSQFYDLFSGRFFMRVVFRAIQDESLSSFKSSFPGIGLRFAMDWAIYNLDAPVKTLILVSLADHCLHDLLYRWRTNSLPIEITGIVSNHDKLREIATANGLPFHHFPANDKAEHEAGINSLIKTTATELILLARYMQVLSPDFCDGHKGHAINIHHSFLPGFKGAKPYHQAYERGVKIIGATAHFVTPDLDEGPIITQAVENIDHAHNPEKMQQIGRDIESRVLVKAARLYTERRIFLHGSRTVIL